MLTDRASVYLGQGRKLAETLLETSPERPDYKLELASTLAALSETRLAQGEKMSAEKTLARATELADGIDRTKVLDASFLPKLAALYERAAALHQKALDAEAGLLLQQRATVVWEECLARMPAAASLRKEGAGAFAAYGHALARAQRHAEAELAFCRAEELRETPVQSQSPAQAGRPRAGVPQVRRARAVAVGNGPARRLVRVKQLQIRGRRTHVVQPASPATVRWPKRREREQPKPMAKSD